jgi:hypothetical protein
MAQDILIDPEIRDWVLIPIMIVMVCIGILRHYVTLLLSSSTPKLEIKGIRESLALARSRNLQSNSQILPFYAFEIHKKHLTTAFQAGEYLKNKNGKQNGESGDPLQGMPDPKQMEVVMDGLKKNMGMMIPQMIIMGWVNYFFSGFVIVKLPFPLTLRFKSMLQRGIETNDMDVTWVSSLSWYFLNLFGLKGIYSLLLGEGNAADGSKDMQNMANQNQAAMGQPVDMQKIFLTEKEALELAEHYWEMQNIEEKVLKKFNISLSLKKQQ